MNSNTKILKTWSVGKAVQGQIRMICIPPGRDESRSYNEVEDTHAQSVLAFSIPLIAVPKLLFDFFT